MTQNSLGRHSQSFLVNLAVLTGPDAWLLLQCCTSKTSSSTWRTGQTNTDPLVVFCGNVLAVDHSVPKQLKSCICWVHVFVHFRVGKQIQSSWPKATRSCLWDLPRVCGFAAEDRSYVLKTWRAGFFFQRVGKYSLKALFIWEDLLEGVGVNLRIRVRFLLSVRCWISIWRLPWGLVCRHVFVRNKFWTDHWQEKDVWNDIYVRKSIRFHPSLIPEFLGRISWHSCSFKRLTYRSLLPHRWWRGFGLLQRWQLLGVREYGWSFLVGQQFDFLIAFGFKMF